MSDPKGPEWKRPKEAWPVADIPDLKKKDTERKKAGVGWGSGQTAGSPFQGASGGGGAAGGAASAASRAASLSGAAVQGPTAAVGLLGRLGAALTGKMVVAMGVVMVVAGAGLYVISGRMSAAAGAGAGRPDLGAVASSMKIRPGSPGGRFEKIVTLLRGEIKFEEAKRPAASVAAPAAQSVDAAEKAPAAEKAAGMEFSGVQAVAPAARDTLAHDLSGSKLTTQLGGSPFSGMNVSSMHAGLAPRFGQSLGRGSGLALAGPLAQRGALGGAIRRSSRAASGRAMDVRRARSSRAIGQLKLARSLSMIGAGSHTDELSRTMAADAFDGGLTKGGEMAAPPDMPPGPSKTGPVSPVGGLGGGAPDTTMPTEQETVAGQNVTPYQNPLDSALALGAQAGKLKIMSMMLIAIGIILIAIGSSMGLWGWAVIAAGIALIAMGIMMLMQAMQMAAQAKALAEGIKAQYGQEYQQDIVDECMDQAVGSGTQPKDCNPSTRPDPKSDTSELTKERDSTFELESGKPVE